ncbi:hypothetical protein H4Q32_024238 [Labeo rohita]|uniref:Reverse transcriptase domain-containing protein n=1 Tax=Labeo rohita TaxID=84645 RepID=A0ABQ8LYB5_LABRO|nr:hypothetical protein H4Q32_024238 [Labeo rohita]
MADIALPPFLSRRASDSLDPLVTVLRNFHLGSGADLSTAWKKTLLLHCLGAEGQRVLAALESGTTSDYDTAGELLNAHFAVPQNAFCSAKDTSCPVSLCNKPDDLSLSRAITIAVRIESAAACALALTKQQTIADLPRPQAQTPWRCNNCRSSSHLSRTQNCPAHGQTCRNCAPAASLCGYGDSKIDLVGSLQVTVGYGNKLMPNFTFHVARCRANLMGCLTAFAHQPLLNPTIKPVIQPLRRIPLALCDSVSAELKQLLDIGIIEPADVSPWVSKLVFHGSTVFFKLDLRQGYLQVPLHPSSRNLTAFVTHAGVPSCFQKIMVSMLAGIPGWPFTWMMWLSMGPPTRVTTNASAESLRP